MSIDIINVSYKNASSLKSLFNKVGFNWLYFNFLSLPSLFPPPLSPLDLMTNVILTGIYLTLYLEMLSSIRQTQEAEIELIRKFLFLKQLFICWYFQTISYLKNLSITARLTTLTGWLGNFEKITIKLSEENVLIIQYKVFHWYIV